MGGPLDAHFAPGLLLPLCGPGCCIWSSSDLVCSLARMERVSEGELQELHFRRFVYDVRQVNIQFLQIRRGLE